MIIIYQKRVVIFEPADEESFKKLVETMIHSTQKWIRDGRPNSGT